MAKLVRDNIIEIMKAEGKEPAFHVADDVEKAKKTKFDLRGGFEKRIILDEA